MSVGERVGSRVIAVLAIASTCGGAEESATASTAALGAGLPAAGAEESATASTAALGAGLPAAGAGGVQERASGTGRAERFLTAGVTLGELTAADETDGLAAARMGLTSFWRAG